MKHFAKTYSDIALRSTGAAMLAIAITACDREAGGYVAPARESGVKSGQSAAHGGGPVVTVYKTPTCGCCEKWADYLGRHGFVVVTRDVEDLVAVKERFGIPPALRSCHTATIGDGNYVLEGHVPAEDIERLLRTQPSGLLAVPGMPLGSPGMEHPRGAAAYDSVFVGDDGVASTFQHHPGGR